MGFNYGGVGSVTVLDGATVRANEIAVGQGGTIGGNATFDGNVTVDGGGTIAPGASPGILTVPALSISSRARWPSKSMA